MENQRYQILIVEDSETQAAFLQLLLENQGFEVIWTVSAEKALEYLSQNKPDLVIVDHNLPGMNGSEFCRQVKMNLNTRSIPTLMFTIDDRVESEKRGLESGADDYVKKNVDEDILLLKIKYLLQKSAQQEEMLKKEQIKVMLEMACTVCHEFNQPMQVISGHVQLLANQLPKDSEILSDINIIKENIDRMAQITKKLMNITNYKTKKYDHKTLSIDIESSSLPK